MPRSDSCCLPRNTIRPARIDPAALHSPRDSAAPAESATETQGSNHSFRAFAKTRSAPPFLKNCTDCCRSPAQTSSTLRIFRARSRKTSLLRFGSAALRALVLGLLSRSARAASKQTGFSRTLHHSAISVPATSVCRDTVRRQLTRRKAKPPHLLDFSNFSVLTSLAARGAPAKSSAYSSSRENARNS